MLHVSTLQRNALSHAAAEAETAASLADYVALQ